MVEKLDYKLYAHFKKRKLLYLQLVQQTSLFYFSGIFLLLRGSVFKLVGSELFGETQCKSTVS